MQNVVMHFKKKIQRLPACPAWTDEVDKSTLQASVSSLGHRSLHSMWLGAKMTSPQAGNVWEQA